MIDTIILALSDMTIKDWFPWGISCISLVTAHSLSNHRVRLGRATGTLAAICWISYGLLINEPAFIIANCIFFWIYVSALIKFNRKKKEYKDAAEDKEKNLEALLARLSEKEKRVVRLARHTEVNLELIKKINAEMQDEIKMALDEGLPPITQELKVPIEQLIVPAEEALLEAKK